MQVTSWKELQQKILALGQAGKLDAWRRCGSLTHAFKEFSLADMDAVADAILRGEDVESIVAQVTDAVRSRREHERTENLERERLESETRKGMTEHQRRYRSLS